MQRVKKQNFIQLKKKSTVKKAKQNCYDTSKQQNTKKKKKKQASTKMQILWYNAWTLEMSGIQKRLQKMWMHPPLQKVMQ